MNTALLVGIFTTLVFLSSELPPPDATVDAETRVNPGPRTTAITDSSNIGGPITGQDTSPAMSYAADSPKPLGSPADGARVVVDAASTRFDVNKSNFGGKIMKELEAYSLYKNLPYLKALTPGFWTWTQLGPGSNYRWDLHMPLEGGYELKWGFSSMTATGAFNWVEAPSATGLDYWQATDLRHCAYVNKVSGSSFAVVGYAFRDAADKVIGRNDAHYLRFDFKVDGETPFKSPAADPWCLLSADSSAWHMNYRVYVTEDMRLNVVVYSATATNPYAQTKLQTSNTFTRGQWHTLEVYYKTNSKSGAAAYYLDGVRQDLITGLDTSAPANADQCKFMFGCIRGKEAAGKVFIDAIRIHNSYIGTDPGDPRNYMAAISFDSSPITVDDFCYYAELAGATPVLQVAIFPPNTGHDYLTPQFSADFVEYVNGIADTDYTAKARTLDFTHSTPSDNWANLRAARGHVQPHNVRYFTMGNEPYWAERWPTNNPSLYANACYDHITAMKAVDPTLKVSVFMYSGLGWNEAVLTKNKEILDFVCIQHDYSYEMGVDPALQSLRLLGISAAKSVTTGKPYINGHTDSRAVMATYLAGRTDLNDMITSQDEHGYCGIYLPGMGSDLGYAIQRLGYRLETIEQGGPNAWDCDWLLINDRKYTYGIIGSDSLTPSYWAYRLFYDHFGGKYLTTTTTSPRYIIPSFRTGAPLYETPYISAYATLAQNNSTVKIIVINRSADTAIPVNFEIKNFLIAPGAVRIYTVGGAGKTVTDSNLVNPSNITVRESQISISGATFTYNAEPLSMTAMEISKYAIPVLSVGYADTGAATLTWTPTAGAQSYIIQWGDDPLNPSGGTAKYPGGQFLLPADTTTASMQMDPGDTLYAAVKARFPDGSETPLSNIVSINVPPSLDPWKPVNVMTQIIGTTLIVSWNPVPGAAGYRIAYGASATEPFNKSVTATGTSKFIYPGVRGRLYLTVTAIKPDGNPGTPSNMIAVDMP
jgi:hypothetical protein